MSIKSKIILANLAVFGILISGLAYFVYISTVQNEIDAIDLRLELCAAKIITEFEDEWEEENKPEWDDILKISEAGLIHLAMSLRTTDGKLIFANDSLERPSEALLQAILTGKSLTETEIIGGEKFRRALIPVVIDDKVEFTLMLTTSIEEVDARLNRLGLILLGSVLATLFLASVAVYLVTRFSFRPISRMIATAEQISADKLEKRLQLRKQEDEVTRLGRALNDMMDRIESAFRSQRQFVTDASHELRTPLTVIIGELEFIQAQLEQEELKENVQTALGELDRLTRLVDQLLTLVKLDAGRLGLEKESIRFDEILADCIKLLQKEAFGKNIQLQVHIEKAIELNADPIRLKSIILNLLVNAIKYGNTGGTVLASLQEVSENNVELTVSDTGHGITAEDRSLVFNRFYRGARSRAESDGSGLGLSITKELVELHGGQIVIEDSPEGGALFRVIIPKK